MKELTHGEEFKYYSLMRPISIGTYPKKGIIDFENYNSRKFISELGREAWGELIYSRALTEDEINQYDLAETPKVKEFSKEELSKEELSKEELSKEEKAESLPIEEEKTDNLIKPNDEKTKQELLKETLEQGIKDIMESDNFRDWCATSGKLYFNNYSFNNAMLVYIQKNNASHVMGYEAWKKFGKQVQQGAKGIKIFTPVFAKEYKKDGLYSTILNSLKSQIDKDSSLPYAVFNLGQSKLSFTMQRNGIMGLMVEGKEVQRFKDHDEVKKFITSNVLGKIPMYYGLATVFDVADTYEPEFIWVKDGFDKKDLVLENGKPIKNRKGEFQIVNTEERKAKFVKELDLTIPENDTEKMTKLFSVLQSVSEKNGVPMTIEVIEDTGCKGFYERNTQNNGRIVIADGLNATEMVATAFHEIAHSDMHRDIKALSIEMGEQANRSIREVQAEAVAYMTASKFGINTDTSSFQYLAAWSKGKELTELNASMDLILKESNKLFQDIETECANRGLTTQLENITSDLEISNEELRYFTKYLLDKKDEFGNIEKDILLDLKEVENQEEHKIIKEQAIVVNSIKEELTTMSMLINNPQSENILEQLNASKTRIGYYESQFSVLTEMRLFVVDKTKNTLKQKFNENPAKVISELNKEYSLSLSDKELKYLSTSKIVYKFSKLLRDNPQQFVDNLKTLLEAVKQVESKNGSFVEIASCEQWGENKIFQSGSVVHPKIADKIIASAEKEVRKLKIEAETLNEYYPYSKCSLVLYTPSDEGYNALSTRVDIGDGCQSSLKEHIAQIDIPEYKKIEIKKAFIESLNERPRMAEKLKVVEYSNSHNKKDKVFDENNKNLSLHEWKKEIDDMHSSNESDEKENEKEKEFELD